jgi:hypothetical protein
VGCGGYLQGSSDSAAAVSLKCIQWSSIKEMNEVIKKRRKICIHETLKKKKNKKKKIIFILFKTLKKYVYVCVRVLLHQLQ